MLVLVVMYWFYLHQHHVHVSMLVGNVLVLPILTSYIYIYVRLGHVCTMYVIITAHGYDCEEGERLHVLDY